MAGPVANTGGGMTVDEFYAFTDTKPDCERWELIGGEPVLNASPTDIHEIIVHNISFLLEGHARIGNASWRVLGSVGVRVSDHDRPEPDLVVGPRRGFGTRERNDAIVAFEVLSPSTTARDLTRKREACTSLASLTHDVVIAQDAVEVTVFARDDGFQSRTFRALDDVIALKSLAVSLPVAEIYRDVPL